MVPEWITFLVAIVLPFAVGALVGRIVKTSLRLFLGLLAVVAIVPYLGYERLPKMDELVAMAREGFGLGRSMYGWLPVHGLFFAYGLVIGYYTA